MIRVTMGCMWYKSTLLKSVIDSSSMKNALLNWKGYQEYIKKNGHSFKEKKKESKLNHGIEKASSQLKKNNLNDKKKDNNLIKDKGIVQNLKR